ncbi:hypothetical protein NE237_012592 [Protea cynaroides]|uniref:Uncharacterized protein n=1 Tax=Protea cynaroides TaxID=273540 RepID=A0A9Q0H270_9MAGN|nr:hypothetical protein NE237_012592 [Protea cynaroides]
MTTLLHQRLSHAAKAGDIYDLYAVLEQDSSVLEVIDKKPFTNTPLHIAVTAGQTCFVEEITNLKPCFVRKLNESEYSPMHLAAANGHVEIVKQLLKSTILKETALHLAIKHGQLEIVEALLRWIAELKMESLLSRTHQKGNTVLHLATTLRQHQIVKMLCSGYKFKRAAKVNARNNSGLTALDLDESLRHPNETLDVQNISNILHNAGSMRACDMKTNKLPSSPTKQPLLAFHHHQRLLQYLNFRVHEDISLDIRNALLVILVLIAAVTFKVGIDL